MTADAPDPILAVLEAARAVDNEPRTPLPLWEAHYRLGDTTLRTKIAARDRDHAAEFLPDDAHDVEIAPVPAVPAHPLDEPAADHPNAAADDEPAAPKYPGLPPSLTDGLTIWGEWGGAQMRVEAGLCTCEQPESPHVDPALEAGALYLAFSDACYQSTEDGHPYRLTADEARALRDLLNIATARGVL